MLLDYYAIYRIMKNLGDMKKFAQIFHIFQFLKLLWTNYLLFL